MKNLQHSYRNAQDLVAIKDKLAELGVPVVESNRM